MTGSATFRTGKDRCGVTQVTEETRGRIANMLTLAESVQQVADDAFYGHVTQTRLIGADGAGIIQQVNCPGGQFEVPAFDDYHLNIALSGSHWTYSNFDDVVIEGRSPAGQLGLIPGGTAGQVEVRGSFSSLHIALPETILQRTAEALDMSAPPNLESLFSLYFQDPAILWAARTFSETALMSDGQDRLHTDQALWALSALLLQRAGSIRLARRDAAPLGADAFGKVHDMFLDNFEFSLTLTDLADRVSMDVFSFSRAFKARTGRSPYQYLLQLRVERALHMLLSGDVSLIEIAYACGFSSQSHFTTVFRRIMGMTPGMVRAQR